MGSSIALAVSAALALQSVNATAPVPLQPTGNWTVDFAESTCSANRQYVAKDEQVILAFRPGPMSDSFRVALLVTDSSSRVTRGRAKISLEGHEPVEAPFVKGPVKIANTHVVAIDLKRLQIASLDSAKSIHIEAGGENLRMKLTQMGPLMRVLASCERDLLAYWGMDPVVLATIKTLPSHKNGVLSIFSTNDYPRSAVMNEEQGTAGVRFWVGKDGKVRDCKIVESSGSKSIDEQTCSVIVSRARFEPARTATGEAVETIAFQRIRWELPD